MAKIKVHELAKELEIKSKDVITFLQENVRSLRCPSACCIILEKNVTSDSNGRKCLSDI